MSSRVTYQKHLRAYAKANGMGVITIDWISPDGTRMTIQGPAGPNALKHVQASMNGYYEPQLLDTVPAQTFDDFVEELK